MTLLHGFDVSGFQGNTVPTADFVIVKATEGASYSSSRFAAQWKSAKARARHRGAYHFARPEASSAVSQASRFLSVVKPVAGESVWLDLEASDLNQTKTNAWAKAWGDYIRDHAPGVTSGIYMGAGYASNGTGRDLSQHFQWWWFPQYPSSAATTKWPSSVSPWLPGGLTCGWERPHIWQWTSNFNGLDANITDLTLEQLAGGGAQPTPLEDTMPYGGQLQPGAGTRANVSFPKGAMKAIGLVYDSPDIAEVRVAVHHKAGSGEVYTLKVGGPKSATDTWPAKTVQSFKTPADSDWVSLTRLDVGQDPVGWDMS